MLGSILALAIVQSAAPNKVQFIEGTYRGLRCLALRNAHAEAVIVPEVGRLLCFRLIGGRNVLWENPQVEKSGYKNWGGDKVWPAPQSLWTWPPSPAIDGSAYKGGRIGDSVVIASPYAPEKFRFVRRFTLDPLKPRLIIENTIQSDSADTITRSIWQVAQVVVPEQVRVLGEMVKVENYRDRPAPEGQVVPGRAFTAINWSGDKEFKVGTRTPTTLVAVYPEVFLSMSSSDLGPGEYPDFFPVQVYNSPNPKAYMELELAGSIRNIRPGSSASFTSILELEKRS